jgi:2-amino-4-hydroxy-6-hydroxymethyldihydropteridine diphosphokinase
VLAVSRLIETEPLIHPDDPERSQPAYLNGAVLLESDLSPEEVLQKLLSIESELGRQRFVGQPRWRPRHIDLDLIAADNLVLHSSTLTVPHPEMHKRRFVLAPMAEVWGDWVHPIIGKDVRALLDALPP